MEFGSGLVAFAVGAEGDDQSGDEGGASPGEGLKDMGVFVRGDGLGDGGVELGDGAEEDLDDAGQALRVQGQRLDESLVAGEVDGGPNVLDEFLAAVLGADAVLFE